MFNKNCGLPLINYSNDFINESITYWLFVMPSDTLNEKLKEHSDNTKKLMDRQVAKKCEK